MSELVRKRWVGTARRECLDHLLVVGRRHLEHVLSELHEIASPLTGGRRRARELVGRRVRSALGG